MILLGTGSRDWPWDKRLTVFRAMNRASLNAKSVILYHGGCGVGTDIPGSLYKGADGLLDLHGRLLGWDVRPMPADRSKGPSGFAIRNQQMVDKLPDKVLAFFLQDAGNRGTKMTVDMARRKNLWVLEYNSD